MKDFEPIPKRFMVWDKEAHDFVKGVNGHILNWREIANLVEPTVWDCTTELDEVVERFTVIQSVNLFDKDRKEIFEGGIVKNDKGWVGVIKLYKGQWIVNYKKPMPEVWHLLYDIKNDIKLIGHILSNLELLEEK